jgi:hypothetical protein
MDGTSISKWRHGALALLAGAASLAAPHARGTGTCSAHSPSSITPVVELYTSEGCNSCPPADRWLSGLKADTGIVALAFHVDYWDRLGWKDRFANPLYTKRQAQQQRINGARFSYTPQVVVDGVDRSNWHLLPVPTSSATRRTATVDLTLTREAGRINASVLPRSGAPPQLAAYWAVTEQGHSTQVKAGENEGVLLRHDFVVRDYEPVAAWSAQSDKPVTLWLNAVSPAEPGRVREVNLVVLDAATGRPVQALKLGC